jgi:hypothetical protein
MGWFHLPAYFLAGAFLANSVPHFVSGVLGRALPTPFASPPFKGLSSPTVNVAWGLVNLAVAYLLLVHVGEFDTLSWGHAAVCFGGFGAMALLCARSLGRMNDERSRRPGVNGGESAPRRRLDGPLT